MPVSLAAPFHPPAPLVPQGASLDDSQSCFDTLFVVDASRDWYGIGDPATYQYFTERIAAYSKDYTKVVMIGDSMGASAALAYSPLATCVLAFCPQSDLSISSIRPGRSADWFSQMQAQLTAAVSASTADIGVHIGTWQHDIDQAKAVPQECVKVQVSGREAKQCC